MIKRVLLIVILLLAAGSALGYLAMKTFSFAADEPHSEFVHSAITQFRQEAIQRASRAVSVPDDLDSPARRRQASGNYEAMCATCHLKPGLRKSELSVGLYPSPPDLTKSRTHANAATDFWVVKHGIKGSGMAAWGKVGLSDDDIWNLVAFVRALPEMSPSGYAQAVKQGVGHQHSH